MSILVTGGAGYIGSHTLIELIQSGYDVVVVDNLANSNRTSLKRAEKIVGREILFYQIDVRDREKLNAIFLNHSFDCCIHFAGLKAVGESVALPWEYYDNNVNGTLVLLDVMRKHNCKNMVFSSTAAVYGDLMSVPISEDCPKGQCTNPYGQTKTIIEQIMIDMQKADNTWNIVLLRYFNVAGAHISGSIGEDPNGIPNNLMPYITQVAVGRLDHLDVFGDDYDTPDGTGVRDYIHVVDLASGHVRALQAIEKNCGLKVYNLGTGQGYSVLEVVRAFEKVNGIRIPYQIQGRRAGDVAVCYSSPEKAYRELGWKAKYGIEEMCRDSWNWQKNNPNGFEN